MSSLDPDRLCEACGETNPPRANFCLGCGARLATPDELGERRVLTVLFADLSGFTAFSEGSDVEDVRALATEAADRLSEIVDRYGGTVDKIIGDCVMAVWGAPIAHEDDAERGVRAALDMQAIVTSTSERFFGLALSVGLYTGEAIWSPIGPDGRYTALGDTVNTAARLQGAAGKGETLVGVQTHRATADVIDYEDVEPIKAKNKAEPVPAWRAVEVKGARRAAPELPMVGRFAELDRLGELWELVRTERAAYIAAVVGSPGIGKSRLIRGMTERIGNAANAWWGRCLDYGEGITYWPVIEMVKAAAGILHDDSSEETSRKLGVLLEELGSEDLDELRTMAVALANLVAAPTTPRGTYTATEITKGELHWGIRRVFQLLARTRPVILVFEDLHWAEPALLDLVTSFTDLREDAPVLVVGSARPELSQETFTGRRNTRVIEVDALSEDEGRSLVAHMLGSADVAEGPIATLLSSAGGNPLFLEETVRMLVDAGALDDEGRAIADKIASLSIPSSLRGLIAARLDRLSGAQKRAAGRASVVGEAFWSGAVASLDDGNVSAADATVYEIEIDRMLGELEDRDVVRAKDITTITGQREWNFRHALIRDVAYNRIPKSERVRLHARCGSWMSALPGGTDEFVEIVAHHLEQSCLLAGEVARTSFAPPVIDAVRALTRAAEKAEARQGMREAERFYARALALLNGSFPESSTELLLRWARTRTFLGQYEEAHEEMRKVVDRSGEIGRPDLRCRALVSLAEIDILLGRVSEGRSYLEQAEQLEREIDDPSLRVRTAWSRADVHERFDVSPHAAEEDLLGAIALSLEIDNAPFALTGYMRLGALFYNSGKLAEAETQFQSCAELAAEQGSLRHLSWVTAMLGLVRFHRGPRSRADEDLAKAAGWLERTDDRYMQIQALLWWANLKLAADDIRMATLLLRRAAALARETGGPVGALVARSLVAALVRQNRIGEAREVASDAEQQAPAEDPYAQASVQIAMGFVAAAEKDATAARQHFAVALPILKSQGDRVDYGDALLAEARVLRGLGDNDGACDRFESARLIFEEVGAPATVADIDRDLESIPDAKVRSIRRTG